MTMTNADSACKNIGNQRNHDDDLEEEEDQDATLATMMSVWCTDVLMMY